MYSYVGAVSNNGYASASFPHYYNSNGEQAQPPAASRQPPKRSMSHDKSSCFKC